jgi:hypothetical protein
MDVLRGLVVAVLLELGLSLLAPHPLGPHVALPLFLAAFALHRRTVFFRYAAPVLLAFALGIPAVLGARAVTLLPHAAAGLAAWALIGARRPPRHALRSSSAPG